MGKSVFMVLLSPAPGHTTAQQTRSSAQGNCNVKSRVAYVSSLLEAESAFRDLSYEPNINALSSLEAEIWPIQLCPPHGGNKAEQGGQIFLGEGCHSNQIVKFWKGFQRPFIWTKHQCSIFIRSWDMTNSYLSMGGAKLHRGTKIFGRRLP